MSGDLSPLNSPRDNGIDWEECRGYCRDAAAYVFAPLVGLVAGVAASPLWLIALLYAKAKETYHGYFSSETILSTDELENYQDVDQLKHEIGRREGSAAFKEVSHLFLVLLAFAVPYFGMKWLNEDKLDIDKTDYACGLSKQNHGAVLRNLKVRISAIESRKV